MPRIGQNPMKWDADVREAAPITLTTIVHIPMLAGYWKNSFAVLKLFLQSVSQNTIPQFDLMVFDNGSCKEVQDYLVEMQRAGQIRLLILSRHNVGKVSAWNHLFAMAPGDFISYTDSDVYFLPGWLEASLATLEAFPEAGMVTAQPICGALNDRHRHTIEQARQSPSVMVQEGHDLVPEHYIEARRRGLGDTKAQYSKRLENRWDVRLRRGALDTYVGGSHFQFTTRSQYIKPLLPLEVRGLIGPKSVLVLDDALVASGLWRLSTPEYLVHHMGNRLPNLQEELPWTNFSHDELFSNHSSVNRKAYKVKRPFLRRLIKRINIFTFKLLYGEQ